jgi:cephalosporin hydroxylase
MKRILRLARNNVYHRAYIDPESETELVDRFHKLYYDASEFDGTWHQTHWLGVKTLKCPLDLWVYQEILFELRPDVIIETGTFAGGSALYLAMICDALQAGRILTIDLELRKGRPTHPRIQYLLGSSIAPEILERVRGEIQPGGKVLVLLDSDHRKEHVLAEMRAYAPVVTKGSYMIVEDTNLNGHPIAPEFGPGPMEAVDDFLAECRDFEMDKSRQKFYLTFNPKGFLRRK